MSRVPPLPLIQHRRAASAMLCVALLAGMAAPAAAQSYWELSPYRVQVLVAVEQTPELGPRWESDLWAELAQRAETAAGAAWQTTIKAAPAPLRAKMLRSLRTIPVETFAEEFSQFDKIILVSVAAGPSAYRVAARELDSTTRRWGVLAQREVRQRAQLTAAAFDAWLDAFAPLARVSSTEGNVATLQVKAAALASNDSDWRLVHMGDVFQPIMRKNQRDGSPAPDGIQPVPWTFLVAGEVDGTLLRCKIHSGTRNALAIGRRGRVELFALRVRGGASPTELQLRSRSDTSLPLAGYEVFTQRPSGGEMERLGLTNRSGQISIAPADEPLRILYVKHGSRVLGRIPLVPGLTPVETVTLVDDDLRLRIEGQLVGLEETLIDLVAQREMLLARIRSRLDADDAAGAAQLLERLRRLPSREEFAQRISQLEKTASTRDPAAQAEVNRLFERTKGLLGKYLDVKQISEIQTLVDRAKAG